MNARGIREAYKVKSHRPSASEAAEMIPRRRHCAVRRASEGAPA